MHNWEEIRQQHGPIVWKTIAKVLRDQISNSMSIWIYQHSLSVRLPITNWYESRVESQLLPLRVSLRVQVKDLGPFALG